MTSSDTPDPRAEVQAAIEQVLSTERSAEAALAAARDDARATVAAAGERAAAVAARARQRVGALHARCALSLQSAVSAIEQSAAADATDMACDETRLRQFVERVARRLISDDNDRGDR